jgi:hypothetical protein
MTYIGACLYAQNILVKLGGRFMTKKTKIILGIVAGFAVLMLIGLFSNPGDESATTTTSEETASATEEAATEAESAVPLTGSIGTLEVVDLTNCLGSDGTGTWSGEDETGAFWGACMKAPSETTMPTQVRCTMTGYGADGTQLDQFTFEGGVSKTQAILSDGLTNNVDAATAMAIEIVTADCSIIS